MLLTTPVTPANDKEVLLDAADRALGSWTIYAPHLEFFRRRVRRSRAAAPGEAGSYATWTPVVNAYWTADECLIDSEELALRDRDRASEEEMYAGLTSD